MITLQSLWSPAHAYSCGVLSFFSLLGSLPVDHISHLQAGLSFVGGMQRRSDELRGFGALHGPNLSAFRLQDWMRHLGMAPPMKRKCTPKEIAARVLSGSMTVRRADTCFLQTARKGKGESLPQSTSREQTSVGAAEAPPSAMPAAQITADGCVEQHEHLGTSGAPGHTADERKDMRETTISDRSSASTAAQAALKAIKEGGMHVDAAQRAGMVKVVETRRFAGQDVEIAREVKAGSKQAENVQQKAVAAKASTGIDAVLSHIQGVALKLGQVHMLLCKKVAMDYNLFAYSNLQ
jgi:hypothetical protein